MMRSSAVSLIEESSHPAAAKRVLIAGWRGVSHSFAMVNQHQILALKRLGSGIELYHLDMPFFMQHWSKQATGAGFSDADSAVIDALPSLEPSLADIFYRISAPIQPPEERARRTITFAVTEFGLGERSLADLSVPLSAYADHGNLIVTPSRWSRDRMIDFGFPESGVRVVRHGVDRETFRPLSPTERSANRSNLGYREDETLFLNVGLPAWNKGIDLLVTAFAQVRRSNPRARLILKDGQSLYGLSAERVLRDLTAKLPGVLTGDVIGAISVVGGNLTQAELRLLYGVADVYVSPYRAEGFNLPVLEALACGTPVIVSSGGATDDFCDGEPATKIPSRFVRGGVGDHERACRVEPHLPSLIELMTEAAARGPLLSNDHALRRAACEVTESWTWDEAIRPLVALF